MKQPSAELLGLLAVAAQLRAGGSSWESIAARVQRSARTCRGWPGIYADVWRRLYRQAEEALVAEAGAEAVVMLRKLLRSKDEKTSLAAATLLLKSRTSHREQEDPELATADSDGELTQHVAQMKELDDAQLDAFVHAILAKRPAPAQGGPAGTATPPSPAAS